MAMRYWLADTLLLQLSTDRNMDVQYQRCKLTLIVNVNISWVDLFLEYGHHVERRMYVRRHLGR